MITIGIPTYNQTDLLPEAIESALAQTIPCEVIVCCDGDEQAYKIAKKYPVKVINQVNKGLASARNSIIMNMHEDYFLPLDSDDVLLPDCAERIINQVMWQQADVIAPSFREFGLGSREVLLMNNPTIEDFKVANRIGYCAAIKRSALLEVGGYSPRMTFGYEDYHLWFNLLSIGKKIITIAEVLWLYRIKEKSMYTEAATHHEFLMEQIRKDFPHEFHR